MHILKNCPVTIEDVCKANIIHGSGVPTLKGKTVFQQLKRVQEEYIEIPDSMKENIGNMIVAADVMFANRIPFVVSVLRQVNFTKVEYVSQRLKTVLINSIGKIFQFYKIIEIILKRS